MSDWQRRGKGRGGGGGGGNVKRYGNNRGGAAGFSDWPALVIDLEHFAEVAPERLAKAPGPPAVCSGGSEKVCLQYFGTYDFARATVGSCQAFEAGIARELAVKGGKGRRADAVEQVERWGGGMGVRI